MKQQNKSKLQEAERITDELSDEIQLRDANPKLQIKIEDLILELEAVNIQLIDLNKVIIAAEEESTSLNSEIVMMKIVGLPGRVFLGKIPKWKPNIRYFSYDEYARINDAQRYIACGTIALPIFERESPSCLGVVELVLTTQKISYSSDLENIYNALQAIDLRSSDVLGVPQVKVCKSLRVITAKEMEEDAMLENNESYPLDLLFDESVSKEGQMPDDGNILSVCSPSEGVLPIEPFMVPAEPDKQEIKE